MAFNVFINQVPGAIAAFTGPTFGPPGDPVDIPNNGFYYQQAGEALVFADTNPPGQRRGAFAVTEAGNLTLVHDQLKWALVRMGYPHLKALAGTSTYFTGGYDYPDEDFLSYGSKSQGSYLIQYWNMYQLPRTAFLVSAGLTARPTMKMVIDHYTQSQGAQGYMAVEMELTGAQCVVRGPKQQETFGGRGFKERKDHYVVFPPGTSNPYFSTTDNLSPILQDLMFKAATEQGLQEDMLTRPLGDFLRIPPLGEKDNPENNFLSELSKLFAQTQ